MHVRAILAQEKSPLALLLAHSICFHFGNDAHWNLKLARTPALVCQASTQCKEIGHKLLRLTSLCPKSLSKALVPLFMSNSYDMQVWLCSKLLFERLSRDRRFTFVLADLWLEININSAPPKCISGCNSATQWTKPFPSSTFTYWRSWNTTEKHYTLKEINDNVTGTMQDKLFKPIEHLILK